MSYKRTSPMPIAEGGTNATSMATTDGVVYFDGTRLVTTAVGTSTFVLTSNGAGVAPTFQAAGGGGGISTITGDTGGALSGTNITFAGGTTGLSFGGSGTTETLTFAGITANGGTVSLATDATTSTINIATGAGVKTTVLGSVNTTSATTVQSGSGALAITSTNGAMTLNSGTGTLSISNDAAATTISLGTGAAVKGITIGSTNSTSAVTIASGTGGVSVGASANAHPSVFGSTTALATTTIQGPSGGVFALGVAGVTPANKNMVTINTSTGQLGSEAVSGGGGITTINGDSGSATGSTITLTTFVGSIGGTVNFFASGSEVDLFFFDNDSSVVINNSSYTPTTGSKNCAIGGNNLDAISGGSSNCSFGFNSLSDITSGSFNIAIGDSSGSNYATSESSNIALNSLGTFTESNALRIGAATGTGDQELNKSFICGIQGIVVTGTAVLISSSDQLGVAVSSRKFKNNIQDMGKDSSSVMKLRPVTFTWNKDSAPGLKDATDEKQFGLIAEEVAKVMPLLVSYDKEGNPFTVKYNDLPAILLNEIQKLNARIEALEKRS